MPDLPSQVAKRESFQSRASRILKCRKAVRDWIERQWMRRHGKEVERRVGEQELMQYKQMFSMLDADGSGNLDVEELSSAMRFIGMKVPLSEIRERIAVVDASRDGLIDMLEFVQLMAKGTFEGFDANSQRRQQQQQAHAANDCIVTGVPPPPQPRRFAKRANNRGDLRSHCRSRHKRLSPKKHSRERKEPPMSDLPFFLWIPAYHRRRTMASLMQGKVVPDLENLGRDSYAPFEHLSNDRAERVVKEREKVLRGLNFMHSNRPRLKVSTRQPRALKSNRSNESDNGPKYHPPQGLPQPYSKAKPAALVRSETRTRIGRRRGGGRRHGRKSRPSPEEEKKSAREKHQQHSLASAAQPNAVFFTGTPNTEGRDHEGATEVGGHDQITFTDMQQTQSCVALLKAPTPTAQRRV